MALIKLIVVFTSVLVFCNLSAQAQSTTDTKSYISSDSAFTLAYPALWKRNKTEEANAEFCINAPNAGPLNICMIKAEIKKMAQGYESADIHGLADEELKMLKAQNENQMILEVLESTFKKRDDKEWWIIQGRLTYDKVVYFTTSYKTIHNQKVYVFTYFSNEKKYAENKAGAENIILSVAFLKKDASVTNTTATISHDTPDDSRNEKVNNTPQTAKINSPVTTIIKKESTHVNMEEFDFAKEPEYIRKYGDGKVRRISEGKLEVTLTTGNKILLKDVNDAKRMLYESYGHFIGYSDEWNSFIFAGFEGTVKLVNRTTGKISDDILLKELEQKNDTAEVSYDGLHFYKVWSPEKKYMAVVRNVEDGGDAAMELVLYDVQENFKKKYQKTFEVRMFQNSNIKTQYWEPGALSWLNNSILEIKKIRRIGSFNNENPVGNAWLTQQNGKWIITNTKPIIQKTDVGTKVKVVASVSPANTDEVLPYVKPKTLLGGKNPGELGRVLLNAVKNNDAKTWFSCVLEGDLEKSRKDIIAIREKLEQDGISDWNLVKFSRATYSECCTYGKPNENTKYELFQIEFTYGTQFLGIIKGQGLDGGIVSFINGKYVLNQSINASGIFRK